MFKKLLGTTLAELPPTTRLIVLMPIIGLIALSTVIGILWNRDSSNEKAKNDQIEYWKKQSEAKDRIIEAKDHTIDLKQYKMDSMTTRSYNDKVETNIKLQLIIDRQNKQKNLLRK